jgi:hypothetical protein
MIVGRKPPCKRSGAPRILSPHATKTTEARVEPARCGLIAGAAIGLLDAATHASHSSRCSSALGKCIDADVKPYLMHAAVGGLIGVALVAALLLVWHYRNVPSQAARPAAPVKRDPIPERVRHEVWRRDRGTCVECGSRGRLEFDHIIPVSRGGANTVRNIELRCEPCNRRKGARV